MTAPARNRKFLAAVLILAIALVSVALGYPREVANPVLGGGWHCSRTAFVTTCRRTSPALPTLQARPLLFREV